MKILLDTCVSGVAVRPALVGAGHDVVWTGDWENDPGDDAIRPMRIGKVASW